VQVHEDHLKGKGRGGEKGFPPENEKSAGGGQERASRGSVKQSSGRTGSSPSAARKGRGKRTREKKKLKTKAPDE